MTTYFIFNIVDYLHCLNVYVFEQCRFILSGYNLIFRHTFTLYVYIVHFSVCVSSASTYSCIWMDQLCRLIGSSVTACRLYPRRLWAYLHAESNKVTTMGLYAFSVFFLPFLKVSYLSTTLITKNRRQIYDRNHNKELCKNKLCKEVVIYA